MSLILNSKNLKYKKVKAMMSSIVNYKINPTILKIINKAIKS